MKEWTNGVKADEPECPCDQQKDGDGIQQVNSPARSRPRGVKNEGDDIRRPGTDYTLANPVALRTLPVMCTAMCSSEPVPLVS